ncbi:hypothetical protein A6A04_01525 [Paramagnetospirillum marisnigri]|uniref:Sensor protein n=1 Tax=Paramagnetospirillum marisnigri TaxID=1285242 RepID=A0A178MN66_9PROT|nr:heavy metal sensor histidine kinase [Paramagnetospirillum marisnigri]OAN50116.1 hypothetical protein A6A04_01525 [Paramagnetospirillum marisnigri]
MASDSIAGQLTWWFTATSLVLLLAKTLFTYWTMAPVMSAQEGQYVLTTARQIGGRVVASLRSGEMPRIESLMPPAASGFVRVIVGDTVIAETPGLEAEMQLSTDGLTDQAVLIGGTSGRQYWVGGHQSLIAPPVVVQVAVEATEFRLMAPTGGRLWLASGIALILSGIAGYHIARRAIRPLQNLAEAVQATGGSTLDRRIDPASQPQELQPLCGSFNSMLDRLRQSFDMVSHVTDDIAHELRTPLAIIQSQIDVALTAERGQAEYREVLESVREEIVTLSDMVARLLFLSRVENQSVELRRERLDLTAELTAVQEFYEPLALEAGIELDVSSTPRTIHAIGDRVMLRRAITNLVANAIRHTPSGGRVTLGAGRVEDGAEIRVEDTGCGIAPQDIPRLFDRFFRRERAREGGVGLGLAIVKAIITRHGGRIEVESQPGIGTRVTLVLPDGGKA